MLSESVRNWLVQLEIEALDKGTDKIEDVTDEEVSEEERKAFLCAIIPARKNWRQSILQDHHRRRLRLLNLNRAKRPG